MNSTYDRRRWRELEFAGSAGYMEFFTFRLFLAPSSEKVLSFTSSRLVQTNMFKGILVGILLCLAGLALGVYIYFATGRAPAAVSDPPFPFERKFAHMALNAHIARQKAPDSPVVADEKDYLAGAEVYKQQCAVCHGLPDQPKSAIAQGMYPAPPQLFHGTGVTDDPASETYWKAENGIRLTGMPAFKGRLTETQIWQVSVLLANADKIPATVKTALGPPPAAPEQPTAAAAAPAKPKP